MSSESDAVSRSAGPHALETGAVEDAPVGNGDEALLRTVFAGNGVANSAFVGGDHAVVRFSYVDTRASVSEHVYVQRVVPPLAVYPSQHETDALQF